tara:strand:+ start:339 stop:491 length:153 start_codon:yes stop_codon:yes gene_type:complete
LAGLGKGTGAKMGGFGAVLKGMDAIEEKALKVLSPQVKRYMVAHPESFSI